MQELNRWLQDLVRMQGADATHDVDHVERVWRHCVHIVSADALEVDMEVLMAAAYLHDIVSHPKNSPRRSESSTDAALTAGWLLAGTDFPEAKLDAVRRAIRAHSFSAGIPPDTIEAEVLQDADRIEALGAIGVARTFYAGGAMGKRLCDPSDPVGLERKLDEATFVLDHFQAKALGLVETMRTAAGKAVAAERHRRLASFVDAFIEEVSIEPPGGGYLQKPAGHATDERRPRACSAWNPRPSRAYYPGEVRD